MTKYKLVDSPMGEGKTLATIKYLRENYCDNTEKRYIVCVMYKDEQKRYIDSCLNAELPNRGQDSKISVIKDYVKDGKNIITTHATFENFDRELIKLIKNSKYQYDLFIDEQPKVFLMSLGDSTEKYNPISNSDNEETKKAKLIKEIDIVHMIKSKILILRDGKYEWNENVNENIYNLSSHGQFSFLQEYLSAVDLYGYGRSIYDNDCPKYLLALTSIKVFECFSNVWIMSYMLKDSIISNYLDLNGVNDYEYYHIENYELVDGYKWSYPSDLGRIVLADDKYVSDFNLSKAGYKKMPFDEKVSIIRKFKNFKDTITKSAKVKDYIITIYKEYTKDGAYDITNEFKKYISLRRYIACNTKATNDYIDSYIVGYLVDRYFNPIFINLLKQNGVDFNRDLFALSETVQFIWRSNIRAKNSSQKVYVYIAGQYSLNLFKKFLEDGLNSDC